jgi:hypothetical protein
MPLAAWPSTLPTTALRDGYQLGSPADAQARTENEDGPTFQRRKRADLWTPLQLRYRMTQAQVDTLRAFIKADLNAATLPFTLPVWLHGSAGYVSRTVRLQQNSPTYSPAGPGQVFVSLGLEVRDI